MASLPTLLFCHKRTTPWVVAVRERKVGQGVGRQVLILLSAGHKTSLGLSVFLRKMGLIKPTLTSLPAVLWTQGKRGKFSENSKEQLKVKASVYKRNLNLRPRNVLRLPLWLPSPQIFLNLFLKGQKRNTPHRFKYRTNTELTSLAKAKEKYPWH